MADSLDIHPAPDISHSHGAESIEEEDLHLLHIPWEDVLFRHVFSYLTINDLFKLRATGRLGHQCVQQYFTCCPCVNVTRLSPKFNENAFHIITQENCSLRRLVLRNTKNWLSDKVLVPVLGANQKLVALDLTNCTSVSNASMQKAAISCPALAELRLRDCHWLSPESVVVLAMNCSQLRYVDITGCWEVNDDALIVLVTYCAQLEHLSIAKIYGLTDHSISHLAKLCKNLLHLNMQGCWRVTDDSVRLLGEYCKSLRGLQVRECRDVTEISLARLRVKGIRMDVPSPRYQMNPEFHQYLSKVKLQI